MTKKLNIIQDETAWYAEGLRFHCTGCGRCCTGSPGYVWVDAKEIEEIARFLNISVEMCVEKYVRQVDGRYSLLEKPKTYCCVFLKDSKCDIYSVRPKQCRTFPWWQKNLRSEKEWLKAATFCEGINHPDAPIVPLQTIKEQQV